MTLKQKIRTTRVDPEYVPYLRMSRYMRAFVRDKANLDADHVLLAKVGPEIIGIFVYSLVSGVIHAQGTYVEKRWRRTGVGSKLWARARSKAPLATVQVTTLSGEGFKFVQSLFAGKEKSVVHRRT